ncbi:hypothetical protein BN874_1810007 [Candidatus Contendobacter odensis Run_B_J11]|uniref:Uncharacterized protein n=2 Tax=Candidatus Contendibacter odensensis TaxID=1400860 RepID=A0A7U7GAT9_9GAMM|nr:hypothetical protein BN874_1810007 [Candidatus Contendobacter odensis Run_B_J11]
MLIIDPWKTKSRGHLNQRANREQEWTAQYRKVLEYWTQHGSITTPIAIEAPTLSPASREEKGEDSWIKLAHWIAENGNA